MDRRHRRWVLAQSLLAAYLTLTASASLADLVGQKVAAALGLIAAAAQTGMATYLALIDRRDGGAGWLSDSDDGPGPRDGAAMTPERIERATRLLRTSARAGAIDPWEPVGVRDPYVVTPSERARRAASEWSARMGGPEAIKRRMALGPID